MSVYKREFKHGDRWCVYLTFKDGTRYRKVVGTKKEAEKVEQKLRSEMVAGRWDLWEKQEVLFSDLVIEYLEHAQMNKAASTFRVDKYKIEGRLLPYFKHIPIDQITPQMLDSFKRKRLRDGVTPNTVNHELTNLSHMFKMAIRWGYMEKNVVSRVDKMKVPEKPKRFLNQVEIDRLLEAAGDSHIYPLIMTALHTGMRKSELFNLKWTDIDFTYGTVTVQSKDDWHTKNYKSRTFQLTPALYEALIDHRKLHLELGVRNEYVFTYNGQKLKSNIKKSLTRVMKEANLVGVTLHTLRHTFASQLVMAGVSLREAQELMGHQSFETTLQYAHLSEDHVKKQVLKLPFANGSGKSAPRIRHAEPILLASREKKEPHEGASSQGS